MYLEIMKPPTIIVTPKISDATLAIGTFGLGARVGVGITLLIFALAFVH